MAARRKKALRTRPDKGLPVDDPSPRFPTSVLFPLKDEVPKTQDVATAIVMLRSLWKVLTEIENRRPDDANKRAQAMRKAILKHGLSGPRLTQDMNDGGHWYALVAIGETPEDALIKIATKRGSRVEAVRRNVQRYFERLGMPPPVTIPQGR